MTPESLFTPLSCLPVDAALVLPLGISAESAEQAVASTTACNPGRRYEIGEHIARPRQAESLHYVRILRLPDEGGGP